MQRADALRFGQYFPVSPHLRSRRCKGDWEALLLALFAFLNQLPESSMFTQLVVFGHWQLRAEEKIPDRVFMENPVDKDPFRASLKIDAIVASSITIQPLPLAFDDPERFGVEVS